MNHLGQIQKEFVKAASDWNDLSFEAQREYLKQHPGSRKRLTAQPLSPSSFSAGDVAFAVGELKSMTSEKLEKIFAESGLLDMSMQEVTLKDIKFGKNKITASYDVIWYNENENRDERTTNFVSWDGKKFIADVSGVSEPLEDEDEDGGYVENITAHPRWSFDADNMRAVWELWKVAPETKATDVPTAEKELKEYLHRQIDSIFKG